MPAYGTAVTYLQLKRPRAFYWTSDGCGSTMVGSFIESGPDKRSGLGEFLFHHIARAFEKGEDSGLRLIFFYE